MSKKALALGQAIYQAKKLLPKNASVSVTVQQDRIIVSTLTNLRYRTNSSENDRSWEAKKVLEGINISLDDHKLGIK